RRRAAGGAARGAALIAAAALTTARPAFTGLDQRCLIGPAVAGLLHQETVERPALLGRARDPAGWAEVLFDLLKRRQTIRPQVVAGLVRGFKDPAEQGGKQRVAVA